MQQARQTRFSGHHMAVILCTFFGVVIAVNFIMAHYALSTFSGVVVENSYVASQHFNRWLDEAQREKAFGWKAHTARRSDGRVELTLAGAPLRDARITAVARHPLGRLPDQTLVFDAEGGGRFVSRSAIAAQRWQLRLDVRDQGKAWQSEEALQ